MLVMRTSPWLARVAPALLVVAITACTDDEPTVDEVEQEAVVGTFTARFDNIVRGGGVVAEGISMSGRADMVVDTTATIPIAGIPAGATIQRAVLYWGISGCPTTTRSGPTSPPR